MLKCRFTGNACKHDRKNTLTKCPIVTLFLFHDGVFRPVSVVSIRSRSWLGTTMSILSKWIVSSISALNSVRVPPKGLLLSAVSFHGVRPARFTTLYAWTSAIYAIPSPDFLLLLASNLAVFVSQSSMAFVRIHQSFELIFPGRKVWQSRNCDFHWSIICSDSDMIGRKARKRAKHARKIIGSARLAERNFARIFVGCRNAVQ